MIKEKYIYINNILLDMITLKNGTTNITTTIAARDKGNKINV